MRPGASGAVALALVLASCGETTTQTADVDVASEVRTLRILPCACLSYAGEAVRTIGVLGRQVRFSASALDARGDVLFTSAEDPERFSWSSSAPDVASVDVSRGPLGGYFISVTGVAEGATDITARSGDASASLRVNVQDRARLAWSAPLTGTYVSADVAVAEDGTTYVIAFGDDLSHWHAISPEGEVLWSVQMPDTRSTPAIGADGTLYAGLLSGALVAVDAEGRVRWTLEGLGSIHSSPAVGPDGIIYVAGHQWVYAVTPRGELHWTYEAGDYVFHHSSPAIGEDGTVFVGGNDGRLYAIDSDGSLKWTVATGGDNIINASPSIGTDGSVYFGSVAGVFAVDPAGAGAELVLERTVHRSAAIGSDGAVIVGTGWGTGGVGVHAIHPTGSLRWSSTPSTVATPTIAAGGSVYVTGTGSSGEPVIAALDAQGRLIWDYALSEGPAFAMQSPAIGVDGAILAVSMDPVVLHAIVESGSTNGGYEGAPWPSARGNRANTGRVGR